MRYCAWDARLAKSDKSGVSSRAHLEAAAAKRGDSPFKRAAIAALTPPPRPYALEHLWLWHRQIRQGLGAGFDGIASLTWVAFDAWARWTRNQPTPDEVTALFQMDLIARHPDALAAD